jgi:hypothetical protein
MSDAEAFSYGYYIGIAIYFALFGAIFWFVGRWGWIGLVIRIVCAALIALRILALLGGH